VARGGGGFNLLCPRVRVLSLLRPGAGYLLVPIITAPQGNVTTGVVQTFTVTINLDRQKMFTWDLKTSIKWVNSNS